MLAFPTHALLTPVQCYLGDSVAGRLGVILEREKAPGSVARDYKSAEVSVLLAWALTGDVDAGSLPLLAIEGHTVGGQPGELFTGKDMMNRMEHHRTFGDALWAALKAGTNEQGLAAERSEVLTIARGSVSAAATITMQTGPDTVFSLHFGRLVRGDVRTALDVYEADAIRNVGAAMLAHHAAEHSMDSLTLDGGPSSESRVH